LTILPVVKVSQDATKRRSPPPICRFRCSPPQLFTVLASHTTTVTTVTSSYWTCPMLMCKVCTAVQRHAGSNDVTGNDVTGDRWRLWSRVRRGVCHVASYERRANTTQDHHSTHVWVSRSSSTLWTVLPIRLKILLDRLLSTLDHERVQLILRDCGWTHDDYARGYKVQVRYVLASNRYVHITDSQFVLEFTDNPWIFGIVRVCYNSLEFDNSQQ